jgi:hypothetical protein
VITTYHLPPAPAWVSLVRLASHTGLWGWGGLRGGGRPKIARSPRPPSWVSQKARMSPRADGSAKFPRTDRFSTARPGPLRLTRPLLGPPLAGRRGGPSLARRALLGARGPLGPLARSAKLLLLLLLAREPTLRAPPSALL